MPGVNYVRARLSNCRRTGQACRQIGRTVLSLDLLIAAIAVHHNAELVSFDADFEVIASVSALRLNRLTRPG